MASLAWYVLLCVIWGSTWLVIKVGYGGLGPFNVAALRFLIAGVMLAAMIPALDARWPRTRHEWLLICWIGIVLFGADYGLIYWGEQYLDSGLTAILFATLPLITVAFAHVYIPGDRITPRKLAGTLLAFFGVVALFGESLRLDLGRLGPMAAIIAAAVCAAAAGVASKRHGTTLHAAALNAPAMLVGSLVLGVAALVSGEGLRLPTDVATWAAIGYLAVAGSVVTFLVYFSLLKTWSVTSLSFIAVFTPAIALVLGFLFLDERPTVWTFVGANDRPLPTPNLQAFVILGVGNWKLGVVGVGFLGVGSYFTFAGSETPPADPPRNRRLPSARTKFRPTAFCVPSLA